MVISDLNLNVVEFHQYCDSLRDAFISPEHILTWMGFIENLLNSMKHSDNLHINIRGNFAPILQSMERISATVKIGPLQILNCEHFCKKQFLNVLVNIINTLEDIMPHPIAWNFHDFVSDFNCYDSEAHVALQACWNLLVYFREMKDLVDCLTKRLLLDINEGIHKDVYVNDFCIQLNLTETTIDINHLRSCAVQSEGFSEKYFEEFASDGFYDYIGAITNSGVEHVVTSGRLWIRSFEEIELVLNETTEYDILKVCHTFSKQFWILRKSTNMMSQKQTEYVFKFAATYFDFSRLNYDTIIHSGAAEFTEMLEFFVDDLFVILNNVTVVEALSFLTVDDVKDLSFGVELFKEHLDGCSVTINNIVCLSQKLYTMLRQEQDSSLILNKVLNSSISMPLPRFEFEQSCRGFREKILVDRLSDLYLGKWKMKLERVNYSVKNLVEQSGSTQCAVCFDELVHCKNFAILLNCSDLFCLSCIQEWEKTCFL